MWCKRPHWYKPQRWIQQESWWWRPGMARSLVKYRLAMMVYWPEQFLQVEKTKNCRLGMGVQLVN